MKCNEVERKKAHMQNMTIKLQEGTFNLRTAGIIIQDEHILMVQNSGQDFYYTPGGRIRLNESSYDAILREVNEELKTGFMVERMVLVNEDFYEFLNGPYHEICFYYLLEPINPPFSLDRKYFEEEYGQVFLHWLPLDTLEEYNVMPPFLPGFVKSLPTTTVHRVSR